MALRAPPLRRLLEQRDVLRAALEEKEAELARCLRRQRSGGPDPDWLSVCHAHFPWLELLVEVQQEIAASAPLPYYAGPQRVEAADGKVTEHPPYRSAELCYWSSIAQWIYEDAQRRRAHAVLDVAPAYGTLALYAKRVTHASELELVDLNEGFIGEALRARHGIGFSAGNIESLERPWQGRFDLILFTEILEHLPSDPVPTLRKIASWLRPDGILYLSTPDAESWGRLPNQAPTYRDLPPPPRGVPISGGHGHVYHYAPDELREIADAIGLRIERFDLVPGFAGPGFDGHGRRSFGGPRHVNIACRLAT